MPERGEYLLFLGRMSADKGCHRAVEVAQGPGFPLKIAGKMREPAEQEYFEAHVAPHLGNGIEYLGETSHAKKVALLQNARATLFPIEWEEPFGLVMIESMACGTPVIATRWGAVPEVIEHGRSGIVVDDYREMAGALAEADRLEPSSAAAPSRSTSRPSGWCATTWRRTRPCSREPARPLRSSAARRAAASRPGPALGGLGRGADRGERLLEVGDEVVRRLDPDREADEVAGHGEGRVRGRGVGHGDGTSIRLSTPPRLSASVQTFVRVTSSAASSGLPARKEIIPPKSRIWRAAISWPGWSGRPG